MSHLTKSQNFSVVHQDHQMHRNLLNGTLQFKSYCTVRNNNFIIIIWNWSDFNNLVYEASQADETENGRTDKT